MSGDNPNGHTTLVRSNDLHVTASISLGGLIHIHPYASTRWGDQLFAVRFQFGCMDVNRAALVDLVRQAQEALVAADARDEREARQ